MVHRLRSTLAVKEERRIAQFSPGRPGLRGQDKVRYAVQRYRERELSYRLGEAL